MIDFVFEDPENPDSADIRRNCGTGYQKLGSLKVSKKNVTDRLEKILKETCEGKLTKEQTVQSWLWWLRLG